MASSTGHITDHFADVAIEQGDYLLGEILRALADDGRWHRAWTAALIGMAIQDTPDNQAALEAWIDRWLPQAWNAVSALASSFGQPADASKSRLKSASQEFLDALRLRTTVNAFEGGESR